MNIKTLFLVIVLGTAINAKGQDFTDALRYSNLNPQGTARSMGIGGALGSIGGDFSTLSINPAGIGIYRSSEVTITPSIKANSVDGQYLSTTSSDNNTRFNFNNAGVVFTSAKKGRRYEKSKWKTFSFGIGMNRLADYNRDYLYTGTNNNSTATQAYADDANTNQDVETPGYLGYYGYQSYLINGDSTKNPPFYTTIVDPTKGGITQRRVVSERGGLNEVVLSIGGNYEEKLMVGATLGLPIINYSRISNYSESALSSTSDFRTYTQNENLTTTGNGVNLKLGAIYKISNEFRIGAAIHSPTYYTMHDDYDVTIGSVITSLVPIQGNNAVPTVHSSFDYSMTTPWRGILSASGFLGNYGFITADYEYIDYSAAHFNYGPDYSFEQSAVNQDIKNHLQGASNFRLGIEGRVTSFFSLRAGFGYYGNPYKINYGVDGSSYSFSGGFGFRFTHFFIDAAYTHTQYNNPELPYLLAPATSSPVASLQNSLNNAALTVGFKF